MKQRSLSRTLMYLCLLVVVAAAWWSFNHRSSPGPLHSSHANVEKLQGSEGCQACHAGSDFTASTSLAAACSECHTLVRDQMSRHTGIHGALAAQLADDCAQCHHEHIGDSLGLVPVSAFQRAGIGAPDLYDHAHVGGLKLTGKHDELRCVDCHVNAQNTVLAEGQTRFLGLTQACTSCHNDVHKGELGNDCAKCHGQLQPFKDAPLFAHPKTFPLVDGHAHRKCSECHTTPGEFKGLKLDCASCHSDDFDKTTKPAHKLTGLSTDCASCHGVSNWSTTTFVHDKRFVLEGAHAKVACASCHSAGAAQKSVRAHGKNASCVVCHSSPHDARLIEAATRSRNDRGDACVVCHLPNAKNWRDANSIMTPALHAATGFALVKPHDKQACVECHPGIDRAPATAQGERAQLNEAQLNGAQLHGARWKAQFPGRASDTCESCHQDPHKGQFAKSATGNACLACHRPTAFIPSKFDGALHAKSRFPIDGGHRAVACSACHKVVDGVRLFVGTKAACVSCHADIHKGAFDGVGMPATVNGKSDCARCHTTTAFAEITWSAAEHAAWTGEPLTGKHATAACNDCHRRDPPPVRGLAPFKPAPKDCTACHEDVHAGQFRIGDEPNAVNDCVRCHNSNESFAIVAFDHQKDSRFALDEDHRKLACVACHRPVEVAGRGIVRYKPLGVKCADCHDPRTIIPTAGGASP